MAHEKDTNPKRLTAVSDTKLLDSAARYLHVCFIDDDYNKKPLSIIAAIHLKIYC